MSNVRPISAGLFIAGVLLVPIAGPVTVWIVNKIHESRPKIEQSREPMQFPKYHRTLQEEEDRRF